MVTVQKPTVTLNSSVTLSQNTNFPKFLNGPDYAYWYNKAQLMDGVAEENLRFSPEDIERINNPERMKRSMVIQTGLICFLKM